VSAEEKEVKPTDQAVPPPTKFDHEILQAIRRIIRAVDQHSRFLVGHHGITVPQLMCLLVLDAEGTLSIGTLSQRVYLTPSTVTGIVDRLERKGHVVRVRGLSDRRVVEVRITETGHKVAGAAPDPLQTRLVEALHHVPDDEKLSMLGILRRLLALMEVGEIPAAPILEVGPLDAAGVLPASPRTH
jgi:DNA-binding MarR family transcriptional regulator